MKIYVASSHRNKYFDEVVERLDADGHLVYNFKEPYGEQGFQWENCDPDWKTWGTTKYLSNLKNNPVANFGFRRDKEAIDNSDVLVMVTPCGRSAHTEFGYAAGKGMKTVIYLTEYQEPELMYKFADFIGRDLNRVSNYLINLHAGPGTKGIIAGEGRWT